MTEGTPAASGESHPQVIFLMPPSFAQGHPLPSAGETMSRQTQLLEEIKRLFPGIQPNDQIDAERFWEVHLELLSLLRQRAHVWLVTNNASHLQPLGEAPATPDLNKPIIRLGRLPFGVHDAFNGQDYSHPLRDAQQVWPPEDELQAAKDYMSNPVFQTNANRATAMAGIVNESGDYDRWLGHPNPTNKSLVQTLLEFREEGIKRVFLKCRIQKYLTTTVDLEDVATLYEAQDKAREAVGYALVHLEGFGDAFSVQEYVTMEAEYRVVVIGGEIISGAGVIPSFTPLDRTTEDIFDAKVQRRFTSPDITTLTDAELEDYWRFASRVAWELANHPTNPLHTYILDICQIDHVPAIVEINPFVNFGVYANDTDKIMRGILSQAQLLQEQTPMVDGDLDHTSLAE